MEASVSSISLRLEVSDGYLKVRYEKLTCSTQSGGNRRRELKGTGGRYDASTASSADSEATKTVRWGISRRGAIGFTLRRNNGKGSEVQRGSCWGLWELMGMEMKKGWDVGGGEETKVNGQDVGT